MDGYFYVSFILTHLMSYLFQYGSGLKQCVSHSTWCISSADIPHIFPCQGRGRYPHPVNATLFLKCSAAGHAACVCKCKYDDMCFDHTTGTCKFTFLDPDVNCAPPNDLPEVKDSAKVKRNDITKEWDFSKNPHSKNRTIKHREGYNDKDWDVKDENEVVEHHDIHVTNVNSPSDAQNDAMAVRHKQEPITYIVEDQSLFPAWAIALVVLCVVILLMLVVLILY